MLWECGQCLIFPHSYYISRNDLVISGTSSAYFRYMTGCYAVSLTVHCYILCSMPVGTQIQKANLLLILVEILVMVLALCLDLLHYTRLHVRCAYSCSNNRIFSKAIISRGNVVAIHCWLRLYQIE